MPIQTYVCKLLCVLYPTDINTSKQGGELHLLDCCFREQLDATLTFDIGEPLRSIRVMRPWRMQFWTDYCFLNSNVSMGVVGPDDGVLACSKS